MASKETHGIKCSVCGDVLEPPCTAREWNTFYATHMRTCVTPDMRNVHNKIVAG